MEAVQGKELERIFKEEGVIDEDDDPEIHDSREPINPSIQNGQEGLYDILKVEKNINVSVIYSRILHIIQK